MPIKPKSILIIEDDESILFVVKETLEAEGYHVSSANNGEEGLEAVEGEGMPDLILLDMKMPVMDGWQFAKAFKTRHGHSAPIVVMTAAGDAASRASEIDADGALAKPFTLQDLLVTVRRHAASS